LNNSPRFIEAQKLKENLTGQQVSEADKSSIHTFVWDVIRDDIRNGTNVEPATTEPVFEAAPAPAPATEPAAQPGAQLTAPAGQPAAQPADQMNNALSGPKTSPVH
jgi:hypothetical protein